MITYLFIGIGIALSFDFFCRIFDTAGQWLEVLKAKAALKIAEINHKILELEKDNQEEYVQAIGFQVPNDF